MAYEYTNCEVVRVVDGDTLDIKVDVGFRMTTVQRFRLYGYNAPESSGLEGPLGRQAADRLARLCPVGTRVALRTYKGDAFGRWLCDLYVTDPDIRDLVHDAVTLLVREGWGVRWDGRGRRPVFDPASAYPRFTG